MTRSELTHTAATSALELLPDGVLVVYDGEVLGDEAGSVVTVRDTAAPSVLAHRASHDGLTGLLNQHAFRERLASEAERMLEHDRRLSLIVAARTLQR